MGRRRSKKAPLSREALEHVARRFRALSDPTRLQLVQALFTEEHTVQELCEAVGTSPANASKHLRSLAHEGILGRRKDGLYVYYRLEDPSVRALCDTVCASLAQRFHDARRAVSGGP